jgi:uncharacterized protein (TIGR03545 family)
MSKWIRWPGVLAFVLVVGLLAGLWFLLVDNIVRRVIERTGTALVEAKVELAAADLSLFPLGLTLTHLQVTNPDEPMTNAVEISRIAMTLDSLNLLRRKAIVEEMVADGVRLNTPRKTSGAIARQPEMPAIEAKAGPGDLFKLPDVSLKDPKEILAKEDLQSLKLAESLRADIEAEKDRWQKQLSELPDKAKLEDYKRRLEKLKSAGKGGLGGILGGVSEAAALQQDLSRDLERIKGAKKDLETDLATLRKRADEASKAPMADVRRLMDKYSLSGEGLANLSRALLGGKLGEWIGTALRWHSKLEPLLARATEKHKDVEVVKPLRGRGVDVRFKERAPLPDFLVRLARVSVEIPAGTISGRVNNITPDQPVLGAPTTFAFAGEKLKGLNSLKLDGSINRMDPSKPTDQATLRVSGYRLEGFSLADQAGLGLELKQAMADADLKAKLSGEALTASLSSQLKSVQMASSVKAGSNAVAAAIASALSDIKGFRLGAELSGTREQYDLKLTSDLDQVLKDVVGKQFQAQAARLQAELQAAVMEKVKGPLGEATAGLVGMDGLIKELASRLNIGEELLKTGVGAGKPAFKLPF